MAENREHVSVYLTKDEKAALQRLAKQNLRSMASEARVLLLQGLNRGAN